MRWICGLLLLVCLRAHAQTDTLARPRLFLPRDTRTWQGVGVGVPLVGAGLMLRHHDRGFRDLRNTYAGRFGYSYDDYLQYAPAALMIGLKIGGVEGRSSWGRMAVSAGFSAALMAATVNSIKYTAGVMRPDGSKVNSFPSGHTATAFMSAALLQKEYGRRSPWYGAAGYTMATATGVSRILNNRHWLSDVLMGAGIGVLSVELGYLLGDLIFKERGLLHDWEQLQLHDRWAAPSFVGLQTGAEWVMGHHDRLRFRSGPRIGIEGAWFANSFVGVGGVLATSSFPIQGAEQKLFRASALVGAYGSYPLTARWLVGGKLLVGYQRHANVYIPSWDEHVGGVGGGMMEAGASITFRVAYNLNFRLQGIYSVQDPVLHRGGRSLHTLGVGLSGEIGF